MVLKWLWATRGRRCVVIVVAVWLAWFVASGIYDVCVIRRHEPDYFRAGRTRAEVLASVGEPDLTIDCPPELRAKVDSLLGRQLAALVADAENHTRKQVYRVDGVSVGMILGRQRYYVFYASDDTVLTYMPVKMFGTARSKKGLSVVTKP